MSDFIRNKSGQYHKVGTAGRLSLYTAKDNIGTHWLVTRDEEVIYPDYYDRPSVKLLRQRESELIYVPSICTSVKSSKSRNTNCNIISISIFC